MPTSQRIDFFKWSIYLYNGMRYSDENKLPLHTAIGVNPVGTTLRIQVETNKNAMLNDSILYKVKNQQVWW